MKRSHGTEQYSRQEQQLFLKPADTCSKGCLSITLSLGVTDSRKLVGQPVRISLLSSERDVMV